MATLMRNPYCRVMAAAVLAACAMLPTGPASAGALSYRAYLPVVASAPRGCLPIPEERYETIPVEGLSPDPGVPAESHPDLNLALRGYRENGAAYRGLVDYAGSYDTFAPRLQTLFVDQRAPVMLHVYQVFQWDGQWPGVYGVYPILSPEVTLVGLASNAQEKLYAPTSPAEVFHDTVTGKHYVAMVLYAAPDRITLKYTRDDHVITGYTVHIEGICVEPSLLALYRAADAAGRRMLPGVQFGQAIGRAIGGETGVAIRDTGWFMDPRSRKDWWQGLTLSLTAVPLVDVEPAAGRQ